MLAPFSVRQFLTGEHELIRDFVCEAYHER